MHYKRTFILTVLAVYLLTLAACGGSSQSADLDPAEEAVSSQPTPQATAEPATPTPQPATESADQQPETPASSESSVEAASESAENVELLTFNLSGGAIGFCDRLTIREGGHYLLQSCGREFSGMLEQADREVLQTWIDNLASFTVSSESKSGEADTLSSDLNFYGQGAEEADQAQQQIILDWVNGLLIRTRPQPTPPPTVEAPEIGAEGLCPDIERPALLVADYENPSSLNLIDPDSQASCNILLPQPPFGRLITAAGHIYYPAFDPETETLTIIQLSPDGERTPLSFTTVSMAAFGPFNFVLSGDGSRIAWSQTGVDFETEPPVYQSSLWVANIDGSDQRTILDQVQSDESRYVELIRFAPDNQTLYYALQPDGLGGSIFSFSGRFDNVYRLPTSGGEAELLFTCPLESGICVGDVSPDGRYLTYSQPDQGVVQIISTGGSLVNTLTAPASDFLGPAIFGPDGKIAFVSATLAQPDSEGEVEELPRPSPGHLSFIGPPYTGQAEILLADDNVAAVWEWLDENRLAYGSIDETGNIGTAVVTLEGQTTQLSPNFALAVLR